jgi:hypothetical protein
LLGEHQTPISRPPLELILFPCSDTGYRAVPELDPSEDDYSSKYNFPHCPAFAQIGSLRGPFDLGLIPIGAYDPRFIMSSMVQVSSLHIRTNKY